MRISLWLALDTLAFLGTDKPDAVVQKEWAALNGTWALVKFELAGQSLLEEATPRQFLLKDGTIRAKDAPNETPGSIGQLRLDPTRKPKHLTTALEGGVLTAIGIYTLEGDELKVCTQVVETTRVKEREKERPTEFDSRKGALLVFQRAKK